MSEMHLVPLWKQPGAWLHLFGFRYHLQLDSRRWEESTQEVDAESCAKAFILRR